MSQKEPFLIPRHKGKRRIIEMVKNVLIVVLIGTAIYLTIRTGIYDSLAHWNVFETIFGQNDTVAEESFVDTNWTTASYPVAMAVVGDEGRYGVQYSQETNQVYQTFWGLLGEGLLSGIAVQSIEEETWQMALQQKGVYFSYLGDIPLQTLCAWLTYDMDYGELSGSASQLILAQTQEDYVCLYYKTQQTGQCYVLETAISYTGHMESLVSNYKSNGATYAFEYEENAGYDGVDPYMMILTTLPTPTVYGSTNPLNLEDEEQQTKLIEALGFSSRTATQYLVPEGVVVREDEDILRLENDGEVTFQGEVGVSNRFVADGEGVTTVIEACQSIVSNTISPLAGEGEVILSHVEWESSNSYTITFSYLLDGISVKFSDGEAAAKFYVEEGNITQFSLYFRNYTATEETSLVLRESQAAAAMSALNVGSSPVITLCYEDWSGDEVSAGWVVE